jgi:hypothetical protein
MSILKVCPKCAGAKRLAEEAIIPIMKKKDVEEVCVMCGERALCARYNSALIRLPDPSRPANKEVKKEPEHGVEEVVRAVPVDIDADFLRAEKMKRLSSSVDGQVKKLLVSMLDGALANVDSGVFIETIEAPVDGVVDSLVEKLRNKGFDVSVEFSHTNVILTILW